MEAYYSSDEEIAWGPVTLREIKSNLKRPIIKKPNRRHTVTDYQHHTVLCSIQNSKMDENLPEEINKLNISGTSTEYYTPNESLKVSGNSDFLDKISQVINVPCSELSEYASVLEDISKSIITDTKDQNKSENVLSTSVSHEDSCINFIKVLENRTHYDIENFQQSLVEDTIPEEQIESIKCDVENKNHSYEEQFSEEEEVIVLSDDSENAIAGSDVEDIICDEITSFKKENSFDECESTKYCVSEEKSVVDENNSGDSGQDEEDLENVYNTTDSEQHNVYEFDTGIKFSQSTEARSENDHNKIEEDFLITPQHKLSTVKESLSTSPVIVPEIDLTQFDDSVSRDDSLQLNDTLEEMNRFLQQGANYSMPDDDVDEITPVKRAFSPHQFITPSKTVIINKKQQSSGTKSHIPKRNFELPLSEKHQINTLTVTKTPSKANFKVPLTPVRSKLARPTPPKSHLDLKNVVSPVGLYIKNSPRIPLKQKVSQKELSKVAVKNIKSENKENYVELPEIVYEPAKKQIKSIEKHIVVPPYLKKLKMREGEIVKHEGRINRDVNRSQISKKLQQTDITNTTIDQSLLDGTGDVSVLTKKQAYIK